MHLRLKNKNSITILTFKINAYIKYKFIKNIKIVKLFLSSGTNSELKKSDIT